MQGDTDKKKKRRKKKSKFGYYLYAVVILVLTVTNITLASLLLTYVQNIQVSGNKYSQKSEIISWIQEDKFTINSLYTIWKYKFGTYTMPIYLEDVDVSLNKPWEVQVDVTEKQIIGCVLIENQYFYIDGEGLVLKTSTQHEEEVPVIEGVRAETVSQFEYLPVDDTKVFSYIVSLTKEVEKNKLHPDRLILEEDGMTLYFESVCVKLGKLNFDLKVAHLSKILEHLEGQNGVLHMEHYSEENEITSFEKNT